MLLFGFGSSLYSSRPRVSLLHLSFHSAAALLPKIVAFAETSFEGMIVKLLGTR